MPTEKFVRIVAVLITLAMSTIITTAMMAQSYDTVILNGRVMDPETRFDGVRNVGIKDGRIAKITKEKITGKETINAKGHVVAPGFIDTHFHSLDMFAVKFGLRDGVTTGMDLEYGAWPIDTWYAAKDGNWPMNYGTEAPLAFDELFTNAFLLDAPLLISHDNDYGWWEIEEKLKLARAKGLNMWSEY